MSTSYGSALTKCPYYDEESKNNIKCEGTISKTCTHNFKSSAQKRKHKNKFCDTFDFKNCPHFKQIQKKYPS